MELEYHQYHHWLETSFPVGARVRFSMWTVDDDYRHERHTGEGVVVEHPLEWSDTGTEGPQLTVHFNGIAVVDDDEHRWEFSPHPNASEDTYGSQGLDWIELLTPAKVGL